MDDPVSVVQIVLKYLGKSSGSPNAQDFADAEKLLLAIRPYVRNIDSSGQIQSLASGDTCVALAYSGDFVQASQRSRDTKSGVDLGYLIPREGSLVGYDLLAIPRDAPHVDNALQLINFLMDAKVAAHISNAIGNANANRAAAQYLEPSIASNTAIYPTADQLRRLSTPAETSPEVSRVITRIWQKFKTDQ
jgi:putrescine transport system substrate-binding protein